MCEAIPLPEWKRNSHIILMESDPKIIMNLSRLWTSVTGQTDIMLYLPLVPGKSVSGLSMKR